MGIRIHKMLGYGLTDVITQDEQLADQRINPDSPLLRYDAVVSAEGYQSFLEAKTDLKHGESSLLRELRKATDVPRTRLDPCHAFAWEPEYGLANVLCLRPLWLTNWSRLDDIMDYTQETWLRPDGSQTNRVEVLRHGIHPYDGSYMDARTGVRVRPEIMNWIRANEVLLEHPADRAWDWTTMDLLAQEGGFSTHQDATEHLAPLVPEEVRSLAEFGQVFTTPDVWLQLRPMLYTWWA